MNTPAMLVRIAGYWLVGEALAITVVAAAIPSGASWLVILGFVTAYYDDNLFAVHVATVPWTDPAVYFTVQTLVQMLTVAAVAASLTTLVRTNSWQHGVLPNSTPPGRDKSARPASDGAPPAPSGPGGPAAPPSSPTPPAPGSGSPSGPSPPDLRGPA